MVKSDCEHLQNLIPLYIDNMLSEEENDILCEHIKNCKECKETYELLKSVMVTANSVPEILVPEDFHSRLMENVRREAAKKRINLAMFKRTAVGITAAAAVIAFSVVAHVNLPENSIAQGPDEVVTPSPAVETQAPETTEVVAPVAEETKAPVITQSPKPVQEKKVTPKKPITTRTPKEVAPVVISETEHLPAPASLEEESVPSAFSLRDNETDKARMSDYHIISVSVDESEYEKAKEILSELDADGTGYKLSEDSSEILSELSELSGFTLSAKVSETAESDYIVLN